MTVDKGQLISKGNLGVLRPAKNQQNFCKDFFPSLSNAHEYINAN